MEYFNENESRELVTLARDLLRLVAPVCDSDDFRKVRSLITDAIKAGHYRRDRYGIHPVIHNLNTAILLCDKVSPDRNMVLAILLYNLAMTDFMSPDDLLSVWGSDVMKLLDGLKNVARLYSKQAAVESDNFRKLLLTFAKDIRVIIIM
ncbi:MAG: HD domain-containing protein, partial [Muribaculaceae bacterium]|nr:HD domain-containing protein [Muribaculaceae bacterium]